MKASPVKLLHSGKKTTIQISSRRVLKSIWQSMASHALLVTSDTPSPREAACILLAPSVSLDFPLGVTSPSRWVPSVAGTLAVQNWAFMHIILETVYFI